MKYIILISSIVLFASCKTYVNKKNVDYKVYKIELIKSYYVVYCEKENKKYKIVSIVNNDNHQNKKGKKIRIGQFYNFVLINYHPEDKNNNPLTNTKTAPYVIQCYIFTDTKICEEKDIKLYTTQNIVGLYYKK